MASLYSRVQKKQKATVYIKPFYKALDVRDQNGRRWWKMSAPHTQQFVSEVWGWEAETFGFMEQENKVQCNSDCALNPQRQ